MVYIIQCLAISSKNYSKEKLEEYRQDFIKQIKEGCLLLPGAFKLVDVANTDVDQMQSIEIKSSYGKAEDSEDSTAEWIDKEVRGTMAPVCSRCCADSIYPTKYCGNCGISMRNGY